jgi:hypothetical protein
VAPIDQHGNGGGAGGGFLEKLEALGAQLRRDLGEARDIGAGPREIGNETRADRIENREHDNRDTAGRLLRGPSRLGTVCRDNADPQPHEFGGQCRQQVVLPLGRPVLDDKVLALDVPESSEAPPECFDAAALFAGKAGE